MQSELDRSDLRILHLLQEHGHLSAAEVAERLGMTASTCWRRVSRLEELGVIRARVALLDREKLGLSVMVFSHVKLAGHGRDALLRFEQAVRTHPEILECYTLMGETDFLLAHRVPRHQGLRGVLPRPPVALSGRAVGQFLDRARGHQGDDGAAPAVLSHGDRRPLAAALGIRGGIKSGAGDDLLRVDERALEFARHRDGGGSCATGRRT